MSSRRFCITLNNPTTPYPNLETFQNAKFLIYQLEAGESGTPHLQIYLVLTRPTRYTRVVQQLPGCHIEGAKGNEQSNIKYCSKPEGRLEGPWEFGQRSQQGRRTDIQEYRDAILSNATDADLLERFPAQLARFPNFRSTVLLCSRAVEPEPLPSLRDWQKNAVALLDSPPDPRKIHWFYDSMGNTGKSALARHLVATTGAFYCTGGKHVDILFAYLLQNIVIFDLPRDYEDKVPYNVIEQIKNGAIFVSKYASKTYFFKTPYVFIFCNFHPDKNKLSADRWDIHRIE